MSTTKKFSGKAMGYLILLGLVVLSWPSLKYFRRITLDLSAICLTIFRPA